MIYLYINYIDIFIYIHITLIYKYILYWYMPTSSKRCIFCFFRENCFFHPKCIYFWLRTISQQLYVCQKCVHIYAFETFFYPTKRRFLPTKRRFFPTMFYFSVEMPHFPLTKYHGFPCETIIIILQWWDFHMCSNMW